MRIQILILGFKGLKKKVLRVRCIQIFFVKYCSKLGQLGISKGQERPIEDVHSFSTNLPIRFLEVVFFILHYQDITLIVKKGLLKIFHSKDKINIPKNLLVNRQLLHVLKLDHTHLGSDRFG